jgi:lipopolysaccharide transport system permease protein
VAWRNRRLIWRLTKRELEARFRGSILGLAWGFILPLASLAVYTFVFSTIFQARWPTPSGGTAEFALIVFSGLLIYGVFSETLNRAPGLINENVSFVKKVVFPLEILPWIVVASALCNFLMGFAIFLIASLAIQGLPSPLLPLIVLPLVPLAMISLGLCWFLASLGVFLRDIRQVIGILTTMLLFVSPVLYPITSIPEKYRWIMRLNPLSSILEMSKEILFWGRQPDWLALAFLTLFGWVLAWLGYAWFSRTKKAFADVL